MNGVDILNNKNTNNISLDSRIVKAVTHLKEDHKNNLNNSGNLIPRISTQPNEPKIDMSIKIPNIPHKNNDKMNKSIQILAKPKNSVKAISLRNKISIEVKEENKQNEEPKKLVSSTNINQNIKHLLVNRNSNKKIFLKTKSIYLQNLMNDTNIKKYKTACLELIKNDNEIIKLYDECGFEKNNYSYENFINKYFFNNSVFLYKLEMLLVNNNGELVKKNYKDAFYKGEIKKFLNDKLNEMKFSQQFEKLSELLNDHFEFVKKFDFLK